GVHASERLGPALIDADGADGVGFPGILRAVLAPRPRCADAADEIERGIEALWQFDRDLAVADSEGVLGHESSPPARRVGPAAPVPAQGLESDHAVGGVKPEATGQFLRSRLGLARVI